VKEKITGLHKHLSIPQIIAFGFFSFIFTGGLVLTLPICSADGTFTNFVDALFTSTTSVCVTGLVTVPTYTHWSVFGKIVIMILIQLGGLGFMTCFTSILILLGKRVTLKERMIIQDSLGESRLQGLVKLVIRIVKGTFLVEGIGAFFYCFEFVPAYGFVKGVCVSIFTAVSAFCNAGIDLIGDYSLTPFRSGFFVNMVTMSLIVTGGIGFTVWWDLLRIRREMKANKLGVIKNIRKLSLHSKLAITMTVTLIAGGAILFFVLEYANDATMGQMNLYERIMASLFQSITPRTAGFFTIPQNEMNLASQFLTIVLMFIGGSPSGTAGGIKTVTFGIILLSVISVIKGKEDTEIYRRTIPANTVRKSLAIMIISLITVIVATILLSLTEGSGDLITLMYECVSALATVGLTLGITPSLTIPGKLLIIFLMYMGRIGVLTMALMFGMKRRRMSHNIKLPEENVMAG